MNIEYLRRAVSILRTLGENKLADEVQNITHFFLATEDDPMDSDYDSDYSMESEQSFDKYKILDNNREL
jgi:hypothetical protein